MLLQPKQFYLPHSLLTSRFSDKSGVRVPEDDEEEDDSDSDSSSSSPAAPAPPVPPLPPPDLFFAPEVVDIVRIHDCLWRSRNFADLQLHCECELKVRQVKEVKTYFKSSVDCLLPGAAEVGRDIFGWNFSTFLMDS